MIEAIQEILSSSFIAAQAFTDAYYNLYDNKRNHLNSLYRKQSIINWNGHNFNGTDGLANLLMQLPQSSTKIVAYNAHPIPVTSVEGGQCSINIEVSGTISYSIDNIERTFNHTFLLTPDVADPSTHFVAYESFRLT